MEEPQEAALRRPPPLYHGLDAALTPAHEQSAAAQFCRVGQEVRGVPRLARVVVYGERLCEDEPCRFQDIRKRRVFDHDVIAHVLRQPDVGLGPSEPRGDLGWDSAETVVQPPRPLHQDGRAEGQ